MKIQCKDCNRLLYINRLDFTEILEGKCCPVCGSINIEDVV